MDGLYSSDLTDEQRQIIEPLLPRPHAVDRPRTVPRQRIVTGSCMWFARDASGITFLTYAHK
jgi:transposase